MPPSSIVSARVLSALAAQSIEEVVNRLCRSLFATNVFAVALMHDPGRKQRSKLYFTLFRTSKCI